MLRSVLDIRLEAIATRVEAIAGGEEEEVEEEARCSRSAATLSI